MLRMPRDGPFPDGCASGAECGIAVGTRSATAAMRGDSDIRCHDLDGARHIELHRPDALNAWTPAMGQELLGALTEASADPAVRAILITGAGRAFCAGADIKNPGRRPRTATRT